MGILFGTYFEIDTKKHGLKMEISLTEWSFKNTTGKHNATRSISFGPIHIIYINYEKLTLAVKDAIDKYDVLSDDFEMCMDNELNSTMPKNFTLN